MSLLGTLRLRRAQVWLLLLTALAAGLAFLPLFNLLGYEFCLAISLAASLAAAHLGSVSTAEMRERDAGLPLTLRAPSVALLLVVGRATLAGLLLLLLPLLVISLNALRVKNCDYLEGLAFFAMMPVLSVALASSLGALWAVLMPRRWLASLLAVLTVLASLLWGVFRFYDAPPIFAYDPFAGYFPGTLYDESIAIRGPFFAYRLYNLVCLGTLLLLLAHRFDPASLRVSLLRVGPAGPAPLRRGAKRLLPAGWRRRGLTALTLLFLGAAVALHLGRARLGFAHDADSIRQALGGVRRTAHFDIYYPVETDPVHVELLAQDHEFRYRQLAATLGVEPGRISSYLFRSPEEKRQLMGASRTFIAKPWRREVYLQLGSFPQPALKHELAHVFAGVFGDPLFHISLRWRWRPLPHPRFNVGLIEGLAVAADWPSFGEVSVHEVAAALRRTGLAPPLAGLFGSGFLAAAPGRAYSLAGSFCRYLLDRFGAARLRQAYRSAGDFRGAYGRDLTALLEEWQRFLDQLPVSEEQLQLTRERYHKPSLLLRRCGHEVANLQAEAAALAGAGKPLAAAALLERVAAYQPEDPRHRLALAEARIAAGELPAAQAELSQLLDTPTLTMPLRRRLLELQGDLSWRLGEVETAAELYARARGGVPSERRALEVKRWGLRQAPSVRQLVRSYMLPPRGEATSRLESILSVHFAHRLQAEAPKSGLGPYLVGKQLWARGVYAEAAISLRRALRLPLPGPAFRLEAQLCLARCLYASGQLAEAELTLRRLLAEPDLQLGYRLEVEDWLERVRWRGEGRLRQGAAANRPAPSH